MVAELDFSKLAQEFVIGGSLVVAALAVAVYVNPVLGGIIKPRWLGTNAETNLKPDGLLRQCR